MHGLKHLKTILSSLFILIFSVKFEMLLGHKKNRTPDPLGSAQVHHVEDYKHQHSSVGLCTSGCGRFVSSMSVRLISESIQCTHS